MTSPRRQAPPLPGPGGMTSPRPHPSGASSVLAFISFLSSFRTFFASLAPRRAARAEPSLRGPAARRGRPPALRTLASSSRGVRAPGPGPGAAAAGRRPCADPPARSVARVRAAAPARPACPGSRRGRAGAAGRGEYRGEYQAGVARGRRPSAPKFAAPARAAEVCFLEKAPGFGLENPTAKIEPSSWSGSESPAENMERMSDSADKPIDNDAEGVWSPDIEQSFQEALAIYPPCGRRKIILSDEGKMYGRNELIARYIKLRTGKTRTRKQVSSHIQVLARRKSRDFHSKLKDQTAKDKALQHMAAMSSAQIVSATAIHNKLGLPGIPRPTFPGGPGFWPGMIQTGQPGSSQDVKPFVQQAYPIQPAVTAPIPGFEPASAPAPSVPAWQGRSIGTTKLRLVEFSAFLEQQRDPDSYNKHLFVHIGHANHSYSDPLLESVDIRQIYDKFPEKKGGLKELFGKGPQNAFFLVKFWADLNCNIQDDAGAFYGVSSQYESSENMTVTCSTKVCSFGKQVVEKVETEYARFENGRFVYRINRSPMCEYMINFIHKLKHLPEKYMMNSVLENFTILLVVTNRDTQETLLCMACVFEVSNSEHGAQHHIYRLVKD
ncbi:transcriptional enhancer factor TEF-1 isoform X2 [Arvicanthis niloticus]|uniref:transcriptional enhancer factor TEF-1 isoform X2 n=1 Tax=Arvicanthis niloticus TaxID=61156 RepID=UPI00402BD290